MRIPLAWDGGVNTLVDAQTIKDNQLEEAKNSFATLDGLLSKRQPVKFVSILNTPVVIYPVTLFVPDKVLGVDYIIYGTNGYGGSHILSVVRTDQAASSPADDSVVFGDKLPLGGPAKFVNYRGRVIVVVPGINGFYQLNKEGDRLFWTFIQFEWPANAGTGVVAQSQYIPVGPRVVGVYRDRLVFANFGPGMENWMVFADRAAQIGWTDTQKTPPWAVIGDDVLAENSTHIDLAIVQGESIRSVDEVMLQAVGSPLSTALLVNTDKSAIICTGEVAQTIDTDFETPAGYIADFIPNKTNFECGIAGPNAICRTKYGVCWAGEDEVWLLTGNTPVKIGTLISPALRACPPDLRRYWSMATADGIVYLALVTQASTDEYTPAIQHWRLDLRNGLPEDSNQPQEKWFGPQDYEGLVVPDTLVGELSHVCPSIVAVKSGSKNLIVGTMYTVIGYGLNSRLVLISFNSGQGGDDLPYPVIASVRQWSADDNASGTVIAVGDMVRPTVYKSNGHFYVCGTSGVPGATEPNWAAGVGDPVIDGGVTWIECSDETTPGRILSWWSAQNPTPFLMKVKFKVLNFGQAARDKVVRRADLMAYFSSRGLAALRMISNNGANAYLLGPTTIGGLSNAGNDLDLMKLDTGAGAEEYQGRALRPGPIVGRNAMDALTSWTPGDTAQAGAGGVIRGRTIQPVFTDDDGFVIDESNNFISWGVYKTDKPPVVQQAWTAELTKGRYANADELLAHIIVQMNAAQGVDLIGFTIRASPWNYDSAYTDSLFPYLNTFTFTFLTRTATYAVAFIYGPSDKTTLTTNAKLTVYPQRTARLIAMLGFNTGDEYRNTSGMSELFDDNSMVQLAIEQESPVLASPTRICAIQATPYTRSPVVSISDIELDYYIKPGLPFSKVSR